MAFLDEEKPLPVELERAREKPLPKAPLFAAWLPPLFLLRL